MDIVDLIERAEKLGIRVNYRATRDLEAVILPSGDLYINTEIVSKQREKEILAHEMGHWEAGCFYIHSQDKWVKAKCEYLADGRAICMLVPKKDLENALVEGEAEVWELAERFDVSEHFIRKAIKYYAVAQR